jgi:hypothetical protein
VAELLDAMSPAPSVFVRRFAKTGETRQKLAAPLNKALSALNGTDFGAPRKLSGAETTTVLDLRFARV